MSDMLWKITVNKRGLWCFSRQIYQIESLILHSYECKNAEISVNLWTLNSSPPRNSSFCWSTTWVATFQRIIHHREHTRRATVHKEIASAVLVYWLEIKWQKRKENLMGEEELTHLSRGAASVMRHFTCEFGQLPEQVQAEFSPLTRSQGPRLKQVFHPRVECSFNV